jgi:hypothetical protein
MEKPKIVYLCDPTNPRLPDYEIYRSLKKKAQVKVLDVRKLDLKKAMKNVLNCDLFLFHGQMGRFDKATYYFILERLKVLLEGTNAKKVLWLLDKIWGERFDILLYFLDSVDHIFVSDGTWAKRFKCDKVSVLHPAASAKKIKGKFRQEYACDIAVTGEMYAGREEEVRFLKDKFGGRIRIFNNKYEQDLADLCVSAKVVVVLRSPFDDFFWSDRIYTILSVGGFCVHPRTYGLKEMGFVEGKHYMDYYSDQELFTLLHAILEKGVDRARKGIAKNGRKFVMETQTYDNRVDEILKLLQ